MILDDKVKDAILQKTNDFCQEIAREFNFSPPEVFQCVLSCLYYIHMQIREETSVEEFALIAVKVSMDYIINNAVIIKNHESGVCPCPHHEEKEGVVH